MHTSRPHSKHVLIGFSRRKNISLRREIGMLSLITRWQMLLVFGVCFYGASSKSKTPDFRLSKIEVKIDGAQEEERTEITDYLSYRIAEQGVTNLPSKAEQWLLRVGRYRSAVCRLVDDATKNLISASVERKILRCGLLRSRTIRSVRIEGLSWRLLETDLRRRIFLRAGEFLDQQDKDSRLRIKRQRERIETYLERQGFFGSKVLVLTQPTGQNENVDIVIRIEGGEFVEVRNVNIDESGPLSKSTFVNEYKNLCSAVDGLFDTGLLSCYTKTRAREATTRLENEIRAKGYPEARIRLRTRFVPLDELTPNDTRCLHANFAVAPTSKVSSAVDTEKKNETGLSRCVDIDITVRAGPKLITHFTLHKPGDGQVGPNDFADDFIVASLDESFSAAGNGGLDTLSRSLQWILRRDLPSANDVEIRGSELKSALTFYESGATDINEAKSSQEALKSFLSRKGYYNAKVLFEHKQKSADQVEVFFEIWPGDPMVVERIQLLGNRTFTDDELNQSIDWATRKRSWRHGGFISPQDVADDALRLQRFYEEQGWRDATVRWLINRFDQYALEVQFIIDEGNTRYQIAGIRFFNGVEKIQNATLPFLAHCQAGRAAQDNDTPKRPEDCEGNPLFPERLELDAQRLTNAYVANGYPYTSVRMELSPDWTDKGPYIDAYVEDLRARAIAARSNYAVPMPIESTDESPPLHVKQGVIFIDGNLKTDRNVILAELGLSDAPDTFLDPQKISEGTSRLRRTGIFSHVDFDYVGAEEFNKRVHLNILLTERPSLTLDSSLAFSTDDLLVTRLELRDRNFAGRMLDISALIDFGLFVGRFSQAQLKANWPRLWGSDFHLSIQPNAVYSDEPSLRVPRVPPNKGFSDAVVSWRAPDLRRRLFSYGVNANVEWRAPRRFLQGLILSASYERGTRYDNPNALRIPVFSEASVQSLDGLLQAFDVDPLAFGILSARAFYNSVKNPFDPSSGWLGEVAFRFGNPTLGSDERFWLMSASTSQYFPILSSSVLSLRARVWGGQSDLQGQNTSILLSPDLLVLGGDRTVRGFNGNGVLTSQGPFGLLALPTLVSDASTRPDDLVLLGALFNVEYRQTWIRNLFIGDLKWAVFMDVGIVTDQLQLPWSNFPLLYDTLVSDPIAAGLPSYAGASIGAGLRYVLPVGPLSLDLAFSPTHQQFGGHIQFGYAF